MINISIYNFPNSIMFVCPNTLGQSREVKKGLIMLKFDTLVDWMNTWAEDAFFEF